MKAIIGKVDTSPDTYSGVAHEQQDIGGKLLPGDGKSKLGRLWTYVRDDRSAGDVGAPAVWFAYSRIAGVSIRTGISPT